MSARRFHIALSVGDLETSVADYSERLGCPPCVVVPGAYALWRTELPNFSVRADGTPGALRHLGWEDEAAPGFSRQTDCNGAVWECFAQQHQRDEIAGLWPQALSDSVPPR